MKIGTTELLIVLGIALLIFGPSRLPQLGKALGKTISGFKKGVASTEVGDSVDNRQEGI